MTPPSRALRPQVLFVGDDASSAEIAASLLRDQVGESVDIETAGTQPADPGGRTDEMLVAMGLNPVGEHRLSSRALHTADRVIILGAGLDVARLPGPRYEEWDLTRDDLVERVASLGHDLSAVPATEAGGSVLGRLRALLPVSRRSRH